MISRLGLLVVAPLLIASGTASAGTKVDKNRCLWLDYWQGNKSGHKGRSAVRDGKKVHHFGKPYSFGSGALAEISSTCGQTGLERRFSDLRSSYTGAQKAGMWSVGIGSATMGAGYATFSTGKLRDEASFGIFAGGLTVAVIGLKAWLDGPRQKVGHRKVRMTPWEERADEVTIDLHNAFVRFYRGLSAERDAAVRSWQACEGSAQEAEALLKQADGCGHFLDLIEVSATDRRIGTPDPVKVGGRVVPWLKDMYYSKSDARKREVESFSKYIKVAHEGAVRKCQSLNVYDRTNWKSLNEGAGRQLSESQDACIFAVNVLDQWGKRSKQRGWAKSAPAVFKAGNSYVAQAESRGASMMTAWEKLRSRSAFENAAKACQAEFLMAERRAKSTGYASSSAWNQVGLLCENALGKWTSNFPGSERQSLSAMIAKSQTQAAADLKREEEARDAYILELIQRNCAIERQLAANSTQWCGPNQYLMVTWLWAPYRGGPQCTDNVRQQAGWHSSDTAFSLPIGQVPDNLECWQQHPHGQCRQVTACDP